MALLASVCVFGAACKSSGGDDATPSVAPTVQAEPTRVPTPVVAGAHVVSSVGLGYEADIPAGWHLTPNVVTAPNFEVDGYFKTSPDPASPDRPQVNIAVGCAPITAPTTLEEALAAKVEGLKELKREDVRSSDHAPVAGRPAAQVDYIYRLKSTPVTPIPGSSNELALTLREIVLVSDVCVWTVALSVPDAPLGEDEGVLEQFLTKLKLPS